MTRTWIISDTHYGHVKIPLYEPMRLAWGRDWAEMTETMLQSWIACVAPGDTVYAPFALRLAANTSTDASLTVSAVTQTGTVTNLTYTLVRTSSITCNAGAVTGGTVVIAAGTALTSIGTPDGWTQTKGSPQTSAGATQFVCFAVTAFRIRVSMSAIGSVIFSKPSNVVTG